MFTASMGRMQRPTERERHKLQVVDLRRRLKRLRGEVDDRVKQIEQTEKVLRWMRRQLRRGE